jgi:hypothetical protein
VESLLVSPISKASAQQRAGGSFRILIAETVRSSDGDLDSSGATHLKFLTLRYRNNITDNLHSL